MGNEKKIAFVGFFWSGIRLPIFYLYADKNILIKLMK